MIGATLDEARAVLADLVALQPYTGVGPDLVTLCEDVAQSVIAEAFPGALVPVINSAGSMQINVAAPTMSDWRRLKPILLAFGGPTLTGFDGVPELFDIADPVGARLMLAAPAVTAIMRLPENDGLRAMALRGVLRAIGTLARAPELQRSAPIPTSLLLARFQDYLNVGRRDAAADVIKRLGREFRLDALNVKFLEVQLLAAFEEWPGIVALSEFPNLCIARKTPAITAHLLEALYRTYIAAPFDAENVADTRMAFETLVRPFMQSMLITGAPQGLKAGGWRLLALEAISNSGHRNLLPIVADRVVELGWIADLLPLEIGRAHV